MRKSKNLSRFRVKFLPYPPYVLEALQITVLILILILVKIGNLPLLLLNLSKKIILKLLLLRRSVKISLSIPFIPFTKPSLPKFRFHIPYFRLILLLIFLSLLTYYSLVLVKFAQQLPSPERLTTTQRPLTTHIYDRQGRLLYQFYEGQDRKLIKLEDLPNHLVNATIAIEDQNFFKHPGIDIWGILRALKTNATDHTMQGGSTITQQLIKNTLLTTDKTFQRKIKEVALSLWAENIYTKQDILQMYFNEVPFGGPAWGIEAASQMYFGKSASDLNLSESSFLAGLPAAPTEYSPYGTSPDTGKQRQNEVLRRMVEDNYINQNEADQAFNTQLTFKPPQIDIKAPHFVMYVRSVLSERYGPKVVSQGGLKVITTLDLDIQNIAEDIVADQVNKMSPLKTGNGAAMVMEANSGHILAMVGSKDYFDPKGGNFNATLSLRAPGSSIKVITYATAFKQGYSPGTVILDTPVTFLNPGSKPYKPSNYDNKFHGAVTIRTALGSSYNIPAVKLLSLVGIPQFVQTAKDMGITTLEGGDIGLSATLGGRSVKMIDMMTAYNTLASSGVRYDAQPILKVTDSFGNVLEDNSQPIGKNVLSEEVSYLLSDILADNRARTPVFGPRSQLVIPGKTAAAKTGTSDLKRDNWTFGYTPEYVVGAWVGNFDNSPMDPRFTSGISGAAPIWHNIMVSLTKGRPNLAFKRPKGIIETAYGRGRDLQIAGTIPKTTTTIKREKKKDDQNKEQEIITFTDPFSQQMILGESSPPGP